MDLYQSLPKSPGVYFFKNKKGETIYIGKAKSLKIRVSSYFKNKNLLPKTANLVSEIDKIDHIVTQSEIDAYLLEANLIRKYAPKYNVNWKDGKNYPLIEISIKEKIPLVKIVRQEINPKALYFGPYPTGSGVFSLLRFLRKIFPFVTQTHHVNQTCLRSHLNLCPCPNYKNYPKNLRHLISFLRGKRQQVQKKLLKEMSVAAKNKKFEEAAVIKKRIEQLAYVTFSRTKPWDYQVNPNLVSDRINASLLALQSLLDLPALHRIECYDISNTSGQLATGAQVVFVDGMSDKSLYRRYKIKKSGTDIDMIKEVIARRLKSNIPLPNLFIIDGGKEHLFATPVPVMGLAKRLETIYFQNKIIQLPKNSPALHLVQNLRDEAHRFSRSYHFLLRKKKMLGLK